jgi:ABC-type Fe3+-hydroxamate transport system substrate-binding protein
MGQITGKVSMDGSVSSPQPDTKKRQDKRAKFVELAENRTINAIRAIRVIGKLANKSAYEYDDTDVKKITNALSKEIESLKARMTSKNGKDEVGFKL